MRDPERITPMLELIEELWRRYPDMRLGQLLLNTGMTYNTEDDKLSMALFETYGL